MDSPLTRLLCEHFKTSVRECLSDATILVWKMQNAFSEGDGNPTPEIVHYSRRLHEQFRLVEGYIERWAEIRAEEAEDKNEDTEPPEQEAFDPKDNRYKWPEDRR